jgi:hypothetical protein
VKILLLFLIPLSLMTIDQTVATVQDGSQMSVVNFKWSRARQNVDVHPTEPTIPARAVIPQNKTFARNARINDPAGVRDPNGDTIDGRSAAIEKSVQESRQPKSEPRDGFAYHVKVKNNTPKIVEIVFWEYRFSEPANPDLVARRQFLCGVNIRPDKDKELEGFSLSGPSDVVSVGTLANKTQFKEDVLINRVEYSDGTIWQRKDWSFAEVKRSYDRVLREPWLPGTCKGL